MMFKIHRGANMVSIKCIVSVMSLNSTLVIHCLHGSFAKNIYCRYSLEAPLMQF